MRIDHTGTIISDVFSSCSPVFFDNRSGVPFDKIIVSDNRYTEIMRIRCLNLMESSTGSASDADRIIKASNRKSFTIQLECPKCMLNTIGSPASVNAPWCENRVLYIEKIKYIFDNKGERTSIKLTSRGDE